MVFAKVLAAEDHAGGIPVPLPGLLAKKYPSAARSERWAWLFPSHTTCHHPRTGTQVRWRCHECNVQRAVKEAARRCGLDGLTPHYLRHAYATHALHGGAFDVRFSAELELWPDRPSVGVPQFFAGSTQPTAARRKDAQAHLIKSRLGG